MPYGWEGNRRPGVALAGMEFGSEHPAYTLVDLMRYGTLHLFHIVNWPVALRADDVT